VLLRFLRLPTQGGEVVPMNLAWLPPEKPKSVEARFHFDACVSPFAQAVGQMFAVFIADATDGNMKVLPCHLSSVLRGLFTG